MKTFQKLIKAFGNGTLSRAHVFEWYKTFSEGRISVEDDEPAGRQRLAITDKNRAKIRDMSVLTHINGQTVKQHYYIEVRRTCVDAAQTLRAPLYAIFLVKLVT
ncbi:hypothetical protein TNCV_3179951 [Trichonephila clavipes]|nr:hypothetical protein TNCV_3179951 [Trichonephila clavipes]